MSTNASLTHHQSVRVGWERREGGRSPTTDGADTRRKCVRFRQSDQLHIPIQSERLIDTEHGNIVGSNTATVVLVHVHLNNTTALYHCIELAEIVLSGNGFCETVGRDSARYAMGGSQYETVRNQRTTAEVERFLLFLVVVPLQRDLVRKLVRDRFLATDNLRSRRFGCDQGRGQG
uniref:Uncharacterized protein n=1 Tax=Anopheles maculatus TaxID=74869 RepID=A0A182SES0_9DIPT